MCMGALVSLICPRSPSGVLELGLGFFPQALPVLLEACEPWWAVAALGACGGPRQRTVWPSWASRIAHCRTCPRDPLAQEAEAGST